MRALLSAYVDINSSGGGSSSSGGLSTSGSPVAIAPGRSQAFTGFSPLLTSAPASLSSPSAGATDGVTKIECLHNSSRLLAMLAKYRPTNLTPLLGELVSTFTATAGSVPLSVALQSEQTLSELSQFNALRTIDLLLPSLALSGEGGLTAGASQSTLFALHVITSAARHLSATQLQCTLPMLLPPCVVLLCGSAVELRQGAVFLMVQLHAVAGESLLRHPALAPLSPSQRSLLTVYIDRQQKSN